MHPLTRFTTGAALVALALTLAGCSDGAETVVPATSAGPVDDASPSTRATTSVVVETPATSPATTPPASIATSTPPATSGPDPATASSDPVDDPRYPAQPSDVPWPTDSWPVDELPVGIDREAIDAVVDAAFGPPDNEARLRSILAVHRGAIVYERYHPLDGPTTVFNSWSVAKSVTSALIGMFVDDGVFDVNDPAPIEEWQEPGDPRGAITLEELLQMRSGLAWNEAYGPNDPAGMMFASPDWAEFVIGQQLESEPGTQFDYSTGTTAVLAEIMADELGGPEQLTDFIETELMEPLGIESTRLVTDPTGQFAGGLGFDSTARDFARFGYLFLRGGVWDGEQILSPDWIEYSATPSPALPAYGAQWWLDGPPGTMTARGLFGQIILVAPDLDLVIVATTTRGGDSGAAVQAVYDQFAALR